jgi:hypothetical protein
MAGMKYLPCAVVLGIIIGACGWAGAADEQTVLSLTVIGGGIGDRDARTFGVPVTLNQVKGTMAWGCAGWTVVSDSYARRCGLKIERDEETEAIRDGNNRMAFLGAANAILTVGHVSVRHLVRVMRDDLMDTNAEGKPIDGTIGYEFAKEAQWEIIPDAEKPTITLRRPGTPLTTQPVAVLPMREDDERFWLNVKVRGQAVDVILMPQSSDIQAGPDLQKKWDLASGAKLDIKALAGEVRGVMLVGKDAVVLSPDVIETNVTMLLVGHQNDAPTPANHSGLGGSFLNRFRYCVDPARKEFAVLERYKSPAGPPSRPTTFKAGEKK